MLKVYTVPTGIMRANSYILTKDGKHAVMIDCGGKEPLAFVQSRGMEIEYVLLTHGHFDHIGGCAALQAAGAKIGCSKEEKSLVFSADNLAEEVGVRIPSFQLDFTFDDGDILKLAGMEISVIATPGHTPGGVCFLCEDKLFTGDTLFYESVGRTDFPGGSGEELHKSLLKLFKLEADYTVYPGHEEETTLEHERKYNPYR